MRPKRDEVDRELRERAEAQLAGRESGKWALPHGDARLVHELEVHKIELEIQNDELRQTQVAYAELFDFAPIGYVVLDLDSAILDANLNGARMLGTPRDELVRKRRLRDFIHPRGRSAFDHFMGRVFTLEPQSSETCEIALLGPGAWEARLTASVLARPQAKALLAMEDITERKHAEERKRSEEALREKDRRKDEFLAALSHELRNPLSPIRNSLHLLERVEPGGEQARKALALLKRQFNHLVGIVDDLLDVTRISTGKIRLKCEHVDLGEIVRNSMDDYRPDFQAAGITLDGEFCPEKTVINADATRLVQVFGNLLSNALKFSLRDGRVEVRVRREGGEAIVSVRDNGVGIDRSLRERLFEPFVQGPQSLDRTQGGLGLGLAMVKELVELHAGWVEAKSAGLGLGSEFRVHLRVVRPSFEVGSRDSAPPKIDKQRVLVIEDHVDSAEALRVLLELEGHEVRVAYDGAAGIALARDFRPNVVICDIGLPELDGFNVARKVRADGTLTSTYLVALTGYARPRDRDASLQAGFDVHIGKPPSLQELRQALASARTRGRLDPRTSEGEG